MEGAARGTAITAAIAAALAVGQVAAAELTGITTLGGDFSAGNDRIQGVQPTLVAWFCAVAVPLAVTITAGHGYRARLTGLPLVGLGPLAALVVVVLRDGMADAYSAVVTGALLGTVAGLVVAVRPVIGYGLAAHAVLVWGTALVSLAFPRSPLVFAGMVALRSDALEAALEPVAGTVLSSPGPNLVSMLPFAVAVIVLGGALAAAAASLGAAWRVAVAAGAAGPVVAAVTYWLNVDLIYLYNEEAFWLVQLVALTCVVVAAVSAATAAGWRHLSAQGQPGGARTAVQDSGPGSA